MARGGLSLWYKSKRQDCSTGISEVASQLDTAAMSCITFRGMYAETSGQAFSSRRLERDFPAVRCKLASLRGVFHGYRSAHRCVTEVVREDIKIHFLIQRNDMGLPVEQPAFYDVKKHNFVVEPGMFDVLVGSSSKDIRLEGQFEVE